MSTWASRPSEERALLNPAFCSCILWLSASGYRSVADLFLPFDVAFLVLPMVLHRGTREMLPKTVATSLAVWINEHPLSQSHIADRAQTLAPFTKDAMLFGGIHKLFAIQDGVIVPNNDWGKALAVDLRDSTNEVRICEKRAEFVGRWLARAGSPSTVMALLGVKL